MKRSYNGDVFMLDGTKITVSDGIAYYINDQQVYGLDDFILNNSSAREIRGYDSDVVIFTTMLAAYNNIENIEKRLSEKIGKKVVILPEHYDAENVLTKILDRLSEIEKDMKEIKKDKNAKTVDLIRSYEYKLKPGDKNYDPDYAAYLKDPDNPIWRTMD